MSVVYGKIHCYTVFNCPVFKKGGCGFAEIYFESLLEVILLLLERGRSEVCNSILLMFSLIVIIMELREKN